MALITPMTPTGEVNLAELRVLLRFHLEAGTDGLCILGTTGEASVLTMAERKHTTDLLKRTAGKHAVIVVEHDMDFIRRLDCRVTVLHEGAVLAEGSLDFVSKNQEVKNVYLGR